MKVSVVRIQNLRCIEKLDIYPKSYTSLIGPNNAGKSSTLRAVEIILNQDPPTSEEWRRGSEAQPIVIEAEFDEIQDWERKTSGVAAHVFADKIRIRMSATLAKDNKDKQKVETTWESFRQEEEIEGWTEDSTFTKLPKEYQDLAKEKGIAGNNFKDANKKE